MLGTGNLEKSYNDMALKIKESKTASIDDLRTILKNIYVDDETFKLKFKERDFTKNDIARYILIKINDSMTKDRLTGIRQFASSSVEHIAPKSPNADWVTDIPESIYDDFVYKIGNLTLLDRAINRRISNLGWSEKRPIAIEPSEIPLNAILKTTAKWDAKEIDKRTEALAVIASSIWSLTL